MPFAIARMVRTDDERRAEIARVITDAIIAGSGVPGAKIQVFIERATIHRDTVALHIVSDLGIDADAIITRLKAWGGVDEVSIFGYRADHTAVGGQLRSSPEGDRGTDKKEATR